MDESSKVLDISSANLKESVPLNRDNKGSKKLILPKIHTEEEEESPTKLKKKMQRKVLPGYEIADYDTALKFLDTQSYRKKTITPHGEADLEPFGVCDDLSELKEYGLGIYLYLELIKRLFITFVIMSCIVAAPLLFNYSGDGLQDYPESFTLTIAKFSIGNLNEADQVTYLVTTICDILTMITLFIFYLHWRYFVNGLIEESDRDHSVVNPTIYALTVTGFDKNTKQLQDNLKAYFDGLYRGSYEVEVVYDYGRQFSKFVEYDEGIEKVEKQKQILKQASKDTDDLVEYEKQLQEIQEQLIKISQTFQPIYAIIHFRTLKSKMVFLNSCKRYALVNRASYKIKRCLCCMPEQPERERFLGKDELMIENTQLARPEEINWNNMDISGCSFCIRVLISILLLIIVIIITSSLIAFCTLYVSSTSNCVNFDTTLTLEDVQDSEQLLYCYCSAHLIDLYNDQTIQNACGDLQEDILIANIVQIGASVISAVTNVILVIVVGVIAGFILKPETKPAEFSFIFVGVLISNYINSTLLPLLINGNIYGFQAVSYLTWISFIDFDSLAIFKDFDRNWFAIISPYYTNFFIIACLTPFIQVIVFCLRRCLLNWWVKRKCENDDPHKISIQKEVNASINGLEFDYPAEQAILCLQLFMCFMYSSLIPVLIPIFAISLFISFFCKRYVLLHFSNRIPANEKLALKITNLIPFIILVHGLMAVWSHTATGIFSSNVYLITFEFDFNQAIFTRALVDILLLGASALILVWIVFDWVIIGFIGMCRDCSKDDLQLPVTMAAVENTNYGERIRGVNFLTSYKCANNPKYGHAIKAYKQLMRMKRTNEVQ